MAPDNARNEIVPSLLDRLIDDHPELSHEPLSSRFYDVRQLEASVARDLESMLNTRQERLEELAAEFVETGKSLLAYGLPDFTTYNLLAPDDRNRLRRAIENAIARFEPRLQRVRVSMETPNQTDHSLRFRIEALLRVDPATEPVTFDTILQLQTQEYTVAR
ncbi:MAG: type VI secretion system baseplate subunit TssE [Candidatus Binataceae bacterium]